MKVIILLLLVVLAYGQRDPRCPGYSDSSSAFHFPHESDCTKFYKCAFDGEAKLMTCSKNLAYDPELQVCTFRTPELCKGGIGLHGNNKPMPSFAPWPQYPTENKPQRPQIQPQFPNEIQPQRPQIQPPRPQIQPTQPPKLTGIPDIRCKSSPTNQLVAFPHATDCSSFYICDYGHSYLTRCPNGKHWNQIKSHCDWPEFAGCNSNNNNVWQTAKPTFRPTFKPTYQPTQSPNEPLRMDPRCPSVDDPNKEVFLPHERDCSKFYVCGNGFLHLKDCPSGQYWNVRRNWCDWKNEAMCNLHY